MAYFEGSESAVLKKFGFPEEIEEEANIFVPGATAAQKYMLTGWPKPAKRYRMVIENFNMSIEYPYFWMLNSIRQDHGYNTIIKITDITGAGENSSAFGAQVQRLNIQQDKAAQYMGTIANMVKNLFQIVREIRIIRERLEHYHGSDRGEQNADIALKGYWVDLVEGGGKNPASIYGLAQQLGFATLPDLFFNTLVTKDGSIDKAVEEQAGDFNKKVKEVLRRKLAQFVQWRKETKQELETRHKFTLRYLRQHWATIKMYMSWIKPMLRNIKSLNNSEKFRSNPEILSSMETSMMEIEFLARQTEMGNSGHYPVVLAHFLYRSRPQMNYNNEYQRGPSHSGRVTVTLRAYGWTKKQIEDYQKAREDEDLEFLGMIDGSVEAAMEALGDELRKYLELAEEEANLPKKQEAQEPVKKKVEQVKGPGLLDPFAALFGGVKDALLMVTPDMKSEKAPKLAGDPKEAAKAASAAIWQTYKNYKKGHDMLAW